MLRVLLLWSSWTGLFMTINAAQLISPWITPIPNLDAAMEGYDPVMSNPLETPDPGVRNQIFEPLRRLEDKNVVLNSFVAKAHEYLYCESELTEKTLRNYNDYKTEKSSTHSFSAGADASVSTGIFRFSFETSAGYGRESSSEESSLQKFFQETNGEIIESKVQCITHATGIDLFEKPVFTNAFLNALRRLHVASKNPESENSNTFFRQFVASYGTHFMRTTFLGSKLIFEKRFVSKAEDSSSEYSRNKCVANSAYGSIGASFGVLASTSASFSYASEKCGDSSVSKAYFQENGLNSEKIVSVGSLPITNFEEWAVTVKDSPVPVYYELDKISNLFTRNWFDTIPFNAEGDQTEKLNGTGMHQFFEKKSASYCELVLGRECPTEQKGCGFNSLCGSGTKCVEDASNGLGYRCDIKYGGAIIAGGYSTKRLSEVEAFDTWQPPNLPYAINGITLSLVGSKIYCCGGYAEGKGTVDYCYYLDRSSSSPNWKRSTSLPTAMSYHSAAVIGSQVWYVYFNQLFDLNTETNRFRTYNLPLVVSSYHCAVSNATHSYIIGAGSSDDEIWINTVASSPERWHKVATMARGRSYHACLWLNGSVYITGGHSSRRDVEVLNTDTQQVWKTGSLDFGRREHKMMVLGGEAAVVGGVGSGGNLNNIETYDLETRRWKSSSRKLKRNMYKFGLAQLHD